MAKKKGVKTPVKWSEGKIELAYSFSLLGLTNKELAECFNVSLDTIHYWLRTKPAFRIAVERGRKFADAKVASSFFQKAIGYEHEEQHVIVNRVKEYNDEGKLIREYSKPEIVTTIKRYPPDTKAIQYWLNNRTRNNTNNWAQAITHEINGNITNNIQINNNEVQLQDASLEELKLLESIGLKLNEGGTEND